MKEVLIFSINMINFQLNIMWERDTDLSLMGENTSYGFRISNFSAFDSNSTEIQLNSAAAEYFKWVEWTSLNFFIFQKK